MKIDRRHALATVLAGGATLGMGEGSSYSRFDVSENQEQDQSTDRQAIQFAGLNDDEAECWGLVAKAAGKFFQLEQLHSSDSSEVAAAIHVIQNKLLSRPTYRKYVGEAKKLLGEKADAATKEK